VGPEGRTCGGPCKAGAGATCGATASKPSPGGRETPSDAGGASSASVRVREAGTGTLVVVRVREAGTGTLVVTERAKLPMQLARRRFMSAG
jgi:hypothetical protein